MEHTVEEDLRGLLRAVSSTKRALSKGTLRPGISVEQVTQKLHYIETQLQELSARIRERHLKSVPVLHQLPQRQWESLMQGKGEVVKYSLVLWLQ